MQIHVPDPGHTGSAALHAQFRSAVLVAFAFVAVLVAIHAANWALGLDLQRFGVRPLDAAGLAGVLLAPLLHGDASHLLANALPLLVAGTALLHLYPDSARVVLPAIYFGPGAAVWIFGRSSVHIGASGLVYGLVSYIFVAGLLRRDRRAIAASLLVSFMYGALVWGVLPIRDGVSWETHLAATVIGVALALGLRRRDIPPRKRYSWEDEDGTDTDAVDAVPVADGTTAAFETVMVTVPAGAHDARAPALDHGADQAPSSPPNRI
jgi:membrane associated rhomboid family serine protease